MDKDNHKDLQKEHINNYALQGKEMLCTGIILFIVLLIILCLHNYARVIFNARRRRYIRRRARQLLSISTSGTTRPTVSSKGLNPSVLKTIPTVIYSTKTSHCPPIECAVCLSEFENDDKTRVLPKCNHIFHVDCIDMWFYSHSTCPLCRAPVQADIPVKPPKPSEQTVVSVGGPADIEPSTREDIDQMIGSSAIACSPSPPPPPPPPPPSSSSSSSMSSSLSPRSMSSSSSPSSLKLESCPMKTLELAGVEILVL